MDESLGFIEFLKKIESNKNEYVIYLDHNVISIQRKDGEEFDDGYFRTNAYSVLWKLLERKGFTVEEG